MTNRLAKGAGVIRARSSPPGPGRCGGSCLDSWHDAPVRISHFWDLMSDEFGSGYARSVGRDVHLSAVGGRTAVEALDAGVPARDVWRAVCDAMDVPPQRRLGIDRPAREDVPEV